MIARSAHRFYLPPEQARGNAIQLVGDEARHLLQVLRGKVGDRATIFDGRGHELDCTVSEIGKGKATLQVLQRHVCAPLLYQLTLVQAIPKERSMDLILQKATELGAQRIVPLLSERTVMRLDAKDGARKLERWRQITIESAKQCGLNWLPIIEEPQRSRDYFRHTKQSGIILIASLQQDALPLPRLLAEYLAQHGTRPKEVSIAIGPEGDFTPAELADARSAGFRPLSLGPLVLRSETAALYALSILAYELQQAG